MAKAIPASGVLNAADTPCAARDQHRAVYGGPGEPVARGHDRRADLHRRPLAPDRCSAQQGNDSERDLGEPGPEVEQALPGLSAILADRGDDLRNARSGALGRHYLGQPCAEHEDERRDRQRQPIMALDSAMEKVQRRSPARAETSAITPMATAPISVAIRRRLSPSSWLRHGGIGRRGSFRLFACLP